MKITLKQIKNQEPKWIDFEKLLKSFNKTKADSTEVTIKHLLKSNGIDDTIWVIYRCIKGRAKEKKAMMNEIARLTIKPAEKAIILITKSFGYPEKAKESLRIIKDYLKNPTAEKDEDINYPNLNGYYKHETEDGFYATTIIDNAAESVNMAKQRDMHIADPVYEVFYLSARAKGDSKKAAQEQAKKAEDKIKKIILKHFNN